MDRSATDAHQADGLEVARTGGSARCGRQVLARDEAVQEGRDAEPEALRVGSLDHDLSHLSESRVPVSGKPAEYRESACGVVDAGRCLLGGGR